MIDTLLYATTGIAVVGALAAWACTRNQAARLRDLQERIDRFDDALAAMEPAIRPAFPAATVVESPLVVKVDTSDIYAKVADDLRTDLAKAKALGLAYGVRPEGKSPDLAAPYKRDDGRAAWSPPPTPAVSSWLCAACDYSGPADRSATECPKCGRPAGVPESRHPLYAKTGLPNQPVASLRPDTLKPNWACPDYSCRSYQPRAGKPRCPICKGLEIIE